MAKTEEMGDLTVVSENLDYFIALAAEVTVTATRPRKLPLFGEIEIPYFPKERRWTGILGEEFAFLPMPETVDFDYEEILLYKFDGFDDPYNPHSWDWTAEIYDEWGPRFDYGDPYHEDWKVQQVVIKTHD